MIADKPGIQAGDPVAHAWGKTPIAIQGFANRIIHDANAGHADFATMMRSAGAEGLIANEYGASRR